MAGSGSGLKDFPYTIGEPYASAWGSWTHHRGASKDDGSPVSIFVLSGSSREDMHLVAGQNGVKRLRTLSHQDILSCLHSAEIEVSDDTSALQHKIYVVTEPVAPLAEKIKEMNLGGTPRDQYFARGLHQLSKALSYLNNDCKLVHGNISLASVVVTESLDWKLYAFDVLSEFDANNEAVDSPILKFEFLVENQYKAMERANLDWPSIRKSPPWAIDSWGLGCLIYELFSGGKLTRTEDLHKITSIPKSLFPDYQKLLSSTPSHRMNPSEFVHNSEFFLNYLVETIQFNKDGNLDSPSPSGSTGSPKRKWVSTKASGETTVADISKNDLCSKNFGIYPLSEFQRAHSKRRKYTNMSGLSSNDVGHSVLVRGWLQSIKAFGKNLTFLILRDGLSTLQCLLFGDHPGVCADMVAYVKNIAKESFVDIQGTVMLNPKTNKIELHIEKLFVITKASCPLPLQLEDAARGANEKDKRGNTRPQVELTSRLDKRCIDLRTDVTQSIFKIRSAVEQVFAMSMWNSGFTSIGTPKITPGISEGGSAVFDLKYINGKPASLAQSPQLYKQMAINGGMNKVFEIGPVFRAEKSDTTRHLCEYTAMHAEMEVENDYHEVVDLVGTTFVNIFDHLINNCANLLKNVRRQYPSEELKYLRKTLKLKYIEGIAMLKDSGFPIDEFDDLSRSAERKLGQLVLEKYKTEFFILYEYPLSLRPFYTMPSVEQGYSNAFDAFLRGEEILSGSQRIHVKDILTKKAEACGLNMKSLEFFFESFEFGAPPRGGFGAGLERVVMLFLDLPNIRLASLFPRDPVRLSP